MGRKHDKRRHGMNLAEAIIAMQAGRFAADVRRKRGDRDRQFGTDMLRLAILKLIDEEPRRGDELIDALAEFADGHRAPGPEVVYPMLSLLEDSGLIEADSSKKTGKRYRITEAGEAELGERAEEIEPLMARASRAERMDGSEERRAVKNAMRNLAGSLAQRMVSKGVDDELLREVASIVDDAADRINRL